jgi:UDP-glucose 4-epimerase
MMNNMNRFCILGGAGFIGSHLADALWDIGDVTVVDNFSAGLRENLSQFKDRRNFRIIDRDIAGLGDFFKENKFSHVLNLAAQVSTFESVTSPEKDFRTNAEGLFYVLEALRKAKFDGTFIYTSSRSIYGDLLVPLANPNYKANENAPYKPSSIYNTNKYYGELLTKLYHQLYGLKYYIIRPSNVYGPRQPFAGQYNFICVKGDTIILGDNEKIEDITIANKSISINGLQDIKHHMVRNYEGGMCRINARGVLQFDITPEHPLLVVSSKVKAGNKGYVFSEPTWKEAKDIVPKRKGWYGGDYLTIPRLNGNIEIETIDLQRFIQPKRHAKIHSFPLNEETCWLLGIYTAEGYSNDKTGSVRLSINKNETALQEYIMSIIKSLGCKTFLTIDNKRNVAIVTTSSRPLARFLIESCGKGAYNKKMPDFILLHRNIELLKSFLEGYVAGDGHRTNRETSCTTISKTLALQLQLAFARQGQFARIYIGKPRTDHVRGKPVKRHIPYTVNLTDEPIKKHAIVTDKYILTPIKSNDITRYSGPVYNIETEDNTYLVSNITVHNCRWIAWAMQDKPIPIWGKGDQVRDFVYVTDIVNGYRKVIQKQPRNDTFLLSSGKAHDLNYLARLILSDLGKSYSPVSPKTIEYHPPKPGDIQRFVGDSTRARAELDWETTIDLESGIKKTIQWVKDNISRYSEYNL